MIASPITSARLPLWQSERAAILQRICRRIQARERAGQSRHQAVKLFSRRWHGRPLKCDPSRRLALTEATLYRLYKHWRLQGGMPDSFRLHFVPGCRRIAAPVLLRFLNLIADREFKSFRAAWETFCQRGGSYGPGRVSGRPLKLGYDALLWNLPKGCFREFKRCHAAKRQAETEMTELKFRFIAEIESHVPAKLSRRKPVDFQI